MKRRKQIKGRVMMVDGYKVTLTLYRHTITALVGFLHSETKMRVNVNFDQNAPIWKMKEMFIYYSNHIESLGILNFAKQYDIPEA